MKIFFADSAKHLRRGLAARGCELGESETVYFTDGERGFRLRDDVRRAATAVVASVLPDPSSLFDLLCLCRLVRENGSVERTLLIPYLGYARQDRQTGEGEASIGIMVAELLRNLNTGRLVVFDPHSPETFKALGPQAERLSALPLFAQAWRSDPPETIVAPDAGAADRAAAFAGMFENKPTVAIVEKNRPRPNVARAVSLSGEVAGRHVAIVDDMIDTGGTIIEAVRMVSAAGALSIRVASTHGIFSGNARDRLERLPIREIMVANTLPQPRRPVPDGAGRRAKFRVLDVSPLIAYVLC